MKRRAALLSCAFALLVTQSGQARNPALQAQLQCEPEAAPGRILCELRTQAAAGTLVWSDALVVRAPAFARPLRSRFAAQLGTSNVGPGVAWAKLALVASQPGQGELELLARGVVCRVGPSGESCTPEFVAVTAAVLVGRAGPAAP